MGDGEVPEGPAMTRSKRFVLAGAALAAILFACPPVGAAAGREAAKKFYDPIVKTYASKYKVPADLVHSIIKAESDYDCRALSVKGAAGLMQLMPDTATQYGVRDRFDPEDNIMGGVRYLRDLIKLFNNNTRFVLAAYNAGQNAISKFGGIPPYPETREYIRRVMADYPKSTIPTGLGIKKLRTADGRVVFTNDPYYALNSQTAKK
jgi:soluble lytic murein transglycosylase-like protein